VEELCGPAGGTMEEEVQLALPRRSSVGPGQAGLASPTCDQGLGQNIV
jgi:hypothetical protein